MRRILILSVAGLLLGTCKDFVNKKITNQTVSVLAPANNTVIASNQVTFWWEALDGADEYNLQLVKPGFEAIQQLIADTTLSGTKLQLSLSPGAYQWRLRAINGGGRSKTVTFNLNIDTSSNLASQLVVLIGPPAGFVNSSGVITFSWNPVASAQSYNLYVNSNPPLDLSLSTTAYTHTFAPGSYSWKVRAMNAFSISQYTTPRSFKIDASSPAAPNSLAISGNMNSKINDTLKWRRNSPDVSFDSIYIYGNSGLGQPDATAAAGSNSILISSLLPPPSSIVPFWWRLKSVDTAGNRSAFSNTATFTLTP